MHKIRTIEANAYIGQQIQFTGWLHNVRQLGGITFIVLRDGWGTIQAVTEAELPILNELGLESIITLTGMVVETTQTSSGIELHHPQIEVIEPVTESTPIPMHKRKIKAGLPTLLNHAVVNNRHPQRKAVFKLAAGAMAGFRATLNANHFTEVQSPKIVASATESGANVFELGYFGKPAYLAQSPQFYKQIMVGVFERVFEVGPVFRAESHNTTRHINEYVSLDVEFGFIENHFTVMAMVREVLAGIFAEWQTNYQAELSLLAANVPVVPEHIPHIHFAQAKIMLAKQHPNLELTEGDLSPQEERLLGEWAEREHNSAFLFVTGYPMAKRPFYTHPQPENPAYSNSFDLLFRGTELITGGQRLHIYNEYLAALEKANLPIEPFETYLEAFRYGMPLHGGFAIGLERLLMQLLGLPNVRLATLFPRDMQRLTP